MSQKPSSLTNCTLPDQTSLTPELGLESTAARALELVLRHGWNATAFQTLSPGFQYYFDADAYVAYVDTGSAWVVAGAPIASTERLRRVARNFLREAQKAGRRCCFFATEQRFVHAMSKLTTSLHIGEQPVWDPQQWPATLAQHARLREQLKRARSKGVRVYELSLDQAPAHVLSAIRQLVNRWLATRTMPPMGFLVRVEPSALRERGRRFVAERAGQIVGTAHVIPVPRRKGWFIEHLLRVPDAPNGTSELLVDAVMRTTQAEGCSWLTLGLAPLSGEVASALRVARRRMSFLYDFEGLRRFKAKLRPNFWQPIFVTYPLEQSGVDTVRDVLAAFTQGGFLRFGIRALLRGPSAVLATLAVLLSVWSVVLALASPGAWFAGHALVKWAWVVFDIGIFCGLVRLIQRPSRRLATLLAMASTLDAVITPFEAWHWNVPRLQHWTQSCTISAACLAPAVAACILWGTRTRLERVQALHSKRPTLRSQ